MSTFYLKGRLENAMNTDKRLKLYKYTKLKKKVKNLKPK